MLKLRGTAPPVIYYAVRGVRRVKVVRIVLRVVNANGHFLERMLLDQLIMG
jgi:hypothetical protein